MSIYGDISPNRERRLTEGSVADAGCLFSTAGILSNLRATSKKQALQTLAALAAGLTGQPERAIFEALIRRERLGSTGIGDGIAIPHGQLPGLERLHGFFARLSTPIDFDAVDGQPVDLICLLLSPEGQGSDHLKALARLSRLLRDRRLCQALRGAEGAEAIHALLASGGDGDGRFPA